jgi:hypothetical protein
VGKYRRGLQKASRRTTAREGLILHDLELRGLNAEAFRVMLHGGHMVLDDPSLCRRWIFPGSVGHRGTAPLKQTTGRDLRVDHAGALQLIDELAAPLLSALARSAFR